MRSSNDTAPDGGAPVEGVALEPLVAADLDQIVDIEQESFASPWNREHFLYELRENRFAVNRVARRGSRVLGYVCAWQIAGELKINNLAVLRESRRLGLGRWMLEQTLDAARAAGCGTATLEVRPSNLAALRLYAGFGFRDVGRRKGYYQREGEDAVVMEATLSG